MTKRNDKYIEDIDRNTQLDFGGVLRDIHSYPGHYIRVKDALTVVNVHYDYLEPTYALDGSPTEVKYYGGTTQHQSTISVLGDVGGSLQNKYLFIYEGRSERQFHVWFNVDSLGVDPAPANSTGIEIPISTNDNATVVAYAIEAVMKSLYSEYFITKRIGTTIQLIAVKTGPTNDSIDNNTGFTILNQSGTSELLQTVTIDYDGVDPLFEGRVLKNYYYDIYSGSYEKKVEVPAATADNATTPTIANIAVTLANTEYSYVLPTGTKFFSLKDRDGDSKVRIAYSVGGTATTYFTLNMGNVYEVNELYTNTGFTVYFRSNKAGRVIEIESWK